MYRHTPRLVTPRENYPISFPINASLMLATCKVLGRNRTNLVCLDKSITIWLEQLVTFSPNFLTSFCNRSNWNHTENVASPWSRLQSGPSESIIPVNLGCDFTYKGLNAEPWTAPHLVTTLTILTLTFHSLSSIREK